MRAYIIRRLLLIIPTLILVSLIVFLSVRFIPGKVVDMMLIDMSNTGAVVGGERQRTTDSLRHSLGLDAPIHVQYGRWMGLLPDPDTGRFQGVFQGHLGRSIWTNRSVGEEIKNKVPVSTELALLAMVISLIIALPVGIYSAVRQDTLGDYTGRTFAILNLSLPTFWVGTMVVIYPSIWWGWSPPIEYIPFTTDPAANLAQFLIPAFIMGMYSSGIEMRMTRTMMLEVLRQDYIRTAWAKGLSERVIIFRHAMKNAMIPVVTLVGLSMPGLIAGAVVIETIFSLPGMGRMMVEALNRRDYTIVSGVNFVVASAVLLINLGIDLTYAYLDPRVRYQ